MVKRRGKRKSKIGTNTLLLGSVGVLVLAIVGIATLTDVFDDPVFTSIEDVFTLQALLDPAENVKCFLKFELRGYGVDVGSRAGTAEKLVKLVGSRADISSTGAPLGGVLEGQLLSFTNDESAIANTKGLKITRYEVQPELRCDDPTKSSGAIGWGVEPSRLSLNVYANNLFGRSISILGLQGGTFQLADVHDNFAHKFPIIHIDEEVIDVEIPKTTYDFGSKVQFFLGGGINMKQQSTGKIFTHFVSDPTKASPVVWSEHYVKFLKLTQTEQDAPNERVEVYTLRRASDNAELQTLNTAINSGSSDINERNIKILAWLDDFRIAPSQSSEKFPKASLFCLPTNQGGTCSVLSTIGSIKTMEKNDATATNSLADFFKITLTVPQNIKSGNYAVQVFSDDRQQVGEARFVVSKLLTQNDCKANEDLINNRCIEQEAISCPKDDEARDPATNTCVKNTNGVADGTPCASPLVGFHPNCKSEGTDDPPVCDPVKEDLIAGKCVPKGSGEFEDQCPNEGETRINGVCTDDTTGAQTMDAYFQYTITLQGQPDDKGEINKAGVVDLSVFTPQAIVGLTDEGIAAQFNEIRVTPIIDTTPLGTGVAIKSGSAMNTATANVFVNGELRIKNLNIDYPQRTFGIVGPQGLATFGLITIQPANIVQDAEKQNVVFSNGDQLQVKLTFENTFQLSKGTQVFDGVISPMTAEFPFTFVKGVVTGGGEEGCETDEIFSEEEQTCFPVESGCGENQTRIGANCVDGRKKTVGTECTSQETEVGGICIPKQTTNTIGGCTSPLIPNPDTSVGGCIDPASNEPLCPTGTTSLFNPACLFPSNPGTPSGTDSISGSCLVGESESACLTRLQAAQTPLISGGTLTLAIIGFVVLVAGIIMVVVIQGLRSGQRNGQTRRGAVPR